MAKSKSKKPAVLLLGKKSEILGPIVGEMKDLPLELIECTSNKKIEELSVKYDIILLLVEKKAGIEKQVATIEELRGKVLGDAYIIILSETDGKAKISEIGFESAFVEILYKPISPGTLKNKIINHFDSYERRNELDLAVKELENNRKRLVLDEQKIKILTNAVSEPIIFVNQDLIVTFWNNEAEAFFGYTKFEIVNESFLRWLVAPRSQQGIKDLFYDVKRSGAKILKRKRSFHFRNKLGVEIMAEATLSFHATDVEAFNIVFVIHDITLERKLEKETIKARELREENKLMRELLSYVNHELRTPLNAIVGISKTLLSYNSANFNDRQKEGVSLIQKSGEQLLGLIKELLEISQIEANKLTLNIEPFDFDRLLSQQKTQTLNLIGKKNIKFVLKRSPAIPNTLDGDYKKINQILTNILGNAVKYTTEGRIILSSHLIDNKLYFEVSDTGAGIPKDKISSIFDKYSRLKSHTKLAPGTGLGLHITKNLIELMNGEIKAESDLDKGTIIRFFLTLPEEVKPIKPIPVQSEIESRDIRIFNYSPERKLILVIDDSEQNKFIYSILSEQDRYSVMLCENNKRPLSMASEFVPDLIILKFEIPTPHGSSIIKELARRKINVPVIAFSEYGKFTKDLPSNIVLLEEPISLEVLFPVLQDKIKWQPRVKVEGAVIVEEEAWVQRTKRLEDRFIEISNKEEELTYIKICQHQLDFLIIEHIDKNSNGLGLFLKLINNNKLKDFKKIILHHEAVPMKYLSDKISSFDNVVLLNKKEILALKI